MITIGGRYYCSGSQLGMLKALPKKERDKLIEKIIDKQFIGDYPTDKDKKRFETQIKKIK